MTLAAVRDGLVTRLNTISGLRVYETPPDSVPELPAAIVTQGEPFASYDQVMGAADVRYSFEVLLLVRSADDAQAWADLEPYLSPAGASSVKAAVDGTLGGNADWARVTRLPSAGRVTYRRASYWGATFQVEVYESG
jgi:hypothetical protein